MAYTDARAPRGVAVTVRGLRAAYGSREVLHGIDLDVPAGAVVALLGPNGAGKTTTVHVLTTVLRPTGGTATVAGHDVLRDPARVRAAIAVTGQDTALDERLTGRENLRMMARLRHLPRREGRERVERALVTFDLADAADRRVGGWSGGMRRRLDLAASLLVPPDVLFLDEPTTGLDPRSRQAVWQLVRRTADAGTTVLLTTQYLEEADQLADTVVVIDEGRVVARGRAAELKRQVGEAYIELVLTDGAVRRLVTDGSVGDVRRILADVEADRVPVDRWGLREPTLDDVFLALTGTGTTGVGERRPVPTAAAVGPPHPTRTEEQA